MQIKIDTVGNHFLGADLKILTAFQKNTSATIDHWTDKGLKEEYQNLKASKSYKGSKDEILTFTGAVGETVWVIGLGEKTKVKAEDIRKSIAKAFKNAKGKFTNIAIATDGF